MRKIINFVFPDFETLFTFNKNVSAECYLYHGCALFFVGLYEDARRAAEKGSKNALQTRLLFHVAHKLNDQKQLMFHHAQLKHNVEDQLSLASIHYLRSHFDEAADVYKKILAENTYALYRFFNTPESILGTIWHWMFIWLYVITSWTIMTSRW